MILGYVKRCATIIFMPYAPANPCRVPMCPKMQPCPDHVPRDLRRGRGYGRRWRDWRDRWYRRHGRKCAVCLAEGIVEPATELDHIVPVSGPDDPRFFMMSTLYRGFAGLAIGARRPVSARKGLLVGEALLGVAARLTAALWAGITR